MAGLVQSSEDFLVDVFRALGDPLRLDIMLRMVQVPELACTELEEVLPVTKSTISYHMKILHSAGLINIRKGGRYYFYHPRHESLQQLLPELWTCLETMAADRVDQESAVPAAPARPVTRAKASPAKKRAPRLAKV